MSKETYKPEGYNSVSPYFVVDDASRLIDMITSLFDAEIIRRFDREDGAVLHAEIRIDDTIMMIAEANEAYPAYQMLIHVYVEDVDDTYNRALEHGCEAVETPTQKNGEIDKRGMFKDFNSNLWSITQQLGSKSASAQ